MIFSRPLKKVLGRIVPFNKDETIRTENLGTGVSDETKFLNGNGEWDNITALDITAIRSYKTDNYSITNLDRKIECLGTFTITLPLLSEITHYDDIVITNAGVGSEVITIVTTNSELIVDVTSFSLCIGESLIINKGEFKYIVV